MNETTVNFQAKFSKRQEAVVSAFSKIGYTVLWSSTMTPAIDRKKKEIYLPMIRDDEFSKITNIVRGWVDHEMAHEIFDSDHSLLEKSIKKGKAFETIFRMIEDGRIERMISEFLIGCKENLEGQEDELLKNEKTKSVGVALFLLCKYGVDGVDKYKMLKFIKDLSVKTKMDVFGAKTCLQAYNVSQKVYDELKCKEMEDMMDKMKKDIIKKLKSGEIKKEDLKKVSKEEMTGDEMVIEISEDDLKSDKDKSDDDESGKEKPRKSKSDKEGKDKESKKDDSKKSDKKDKSEESEESGESETGKGSTESSDEKSSVSKGKEPSGSDDVCKNEGTEDYDDSDAEKEIRVPVDDKKVEEDVKKSLDEKIGEDDLSEKMRKRIEKEMADSKRSDDDEYISFTKYDKVYNVCDRNVAKKFGKGIDAERVLRDVYSDVNVLSQKLRLEMLSSAMLRNRYKEGGLLDNRRLHVLGMKTSQANVFMNRSKKEAINTAVTLLIDSSGSMSGEKSELAVRIGYLLSSTMEVLGIPNEVLSFTQQHGNGIPEDEIHLAKKYARYWPLMHYVHKSFDAKIRHCIEGLSVFGSYQCENSDGESVIWAASRLVARREKRKILFVISDGRPQNAESGKYRLERHLKSAVDMVSKGGIECIGIGVLDSAVSSFYKNYVVIDNISDVVRKAYGKIADSIRLARTDAAITR